MPKITKIEIVPPMEITKEGVFLGYDPGTKNSSIAILYRKSMTWVKLFQIQLERSDDPVTRTIGVYDLLENIVNWEYKWSSYPKMYACIEGASFGDRYRQVELAEVRASAVVWCHQNRFQIKVMPPLVIRKEVFGNGRIRPQDIWTNIPPDTANALACAYYATSFAE